MAIVPGSDRDLPATPQVGCLHTAQQYSVTHDSCRLAHMWAQEGAPCIGHMSLAAHRERAKVWNQEGSQQWGVVFYRDLPGERAIWKEEEQREQTL